MVNPLDSHPRHSREPTSFPLAPRTVKMRSVLLQQPGLPFRPDNREMITLLQSKLAGDESFGASFIHETDAYSAAPEDLVHGREHAPGTDQGDGKGMRWYFWSPANCHESAQGGSTRRRQRAVRGAGEGTWHSETGKRAVPGEDDRTIGYIRKLSYGIKMKKRFTRLGWCMDEFGLESQDGADQQVLCRLYRSPRAYQAAASYRSQEAPPPIEREPSDHDPPLYVKPENDPICESEAIVKDDAAPAEGEARDGEVAATGIIVVMKFGGSSVASAKQMRDVADLILSFPEEKPMVVLSAMGKTTNNLLLAGEKAVSCGAPKASEIRELAVIRELHLRTIDELGLDKSIVSGFLDELEQLLKDVAMMKELTLRTRDYLVSFGECMSTRILAAYLNKLGKKARQYDAFDLGFITTDDFTNADILEATYPAVAKRLQGDWTDDPAIPIITGSLGKGWKTCAITTLGRGGGDLTATTIGKALGLRKIQVWKDVDGVMTCDPKICADVTLVPYLTFDEATELACFGAQAMQLAKESGITITVNNSCDPQAPGTVITKTRDTSKSELTSIALKSNITMLDIVSTRMLRQYDFLAKVFSILKDSGTSVDCVAASEGKISFTQAPSKLSSPELIHQELSSIVEELKKIGAVHVVQQRSIISLIGNVKRSSNILEKAFNVLRRIGVNVQMISPGASKVNVSLVVHDDEAKQCVQALHSAFLENGFFSLVEGTDLGKNGSPTPVNSAAAASSSSKRKVAEDHPETRPAVRRQTDEEDNILLADEVERAASSDVLDSSAASKNYTPGCEPAVPSCAERAETEKDPAPCSTPRQTDEEDIQRDDPTPMDDDLDVLASSKEMGSRVQGGETAMARSAPSEVTEEDAGTGSWTDHELMALLDGNPVLAEYSTDMPCPASAAPCVDHPEAPQIVRQERTDTDGGLPEEITSWLFSDNNPMLDGVDDGGALAGLYFLPSILEVQDEQQGLAEAAEVGSGLRTEEEALPPELCQTARCRLCETELMDYYK